MCCEPAGFRAFWAVFNAERAVVSSDSVAFGFAAAVFAASNLVWNSFQLSVVYDDCCKEPAAVMASFNAFLAFATGSAVIAFCNLVLAAFTSSVFAFSSSNSSFASSRASVSSDHASAV